MSNQIVFNRPSGAALSTMKFDAIAMQRAMTAMTTKFNDTFTLSATPNIYQSFSPTWDGVVGEPCDVLIVGRDRADCEHFLSDMEDLGEFEPTNGSRRQVVMVGTTDSAVHRRLRGISVRAADVFLTPSWRVGDAWRSVERELSMILSFHRESLSDCRQWAF